MTSNALAASSTGGRTLLVFGDSLSAAYGLQVDQGWVALLQKRLESQGYGYRVVNASVSGETTSGGRGRLARALDQHKPALVSKNLRIPATFLQEPRNGWCSCSSVTVPWWNR